MSVYAPNTDLRLVKSPLTFGDGHQLDFATAAAQATYFTTTLAGRAFNDFTYQRKDNVIRIPDLAENLYQYNYCTYTNFAGKRIYAFITKIEFINQNCTHIYIKTDVFQTWMFELTVRRCLIKREHVVDDGVFKHTLPENLTCGFTTAKHKYTVIPSGVSLDCQTSGEFNTNYYVCFALSERIDPTEYGSTTIAYPIFYSGGRPDPLYYYVCEYSISQLVAAMINRTGLGSAVVAVFGVPKSFVTFNTLNATGTDYAGKIFGYLTNNNYDQFKTVSIIKNKSTIGTYTPKNNKLFCYPYNYAELQAGSQTHILQYELFDSISDNYMTFNLTYVLSPDSEICAIPKNYHGESLSMRDAISSSDFPLSPYLYDAYSNYLALHFAQLGTQLFDLATSSFSGMTFTPSLANATRTANFIASQYDASHQPRQMRGAIKSGIANLSGQSGVYLIEKTIKEEYAHIIDDYFSMYGYRVDRLGVPQWNSRPNWNYIELENPDISGEAPQDDLDELKEMFSKGLTVWHNPSTFGDYSQNNAPA